MSIIGKSLSIQGQSAELSSGPLNEGKNSGGVSAGLKWAVSGAFILALLSLGGSGYLYRSLNSETRERQALEAAQDQMRGKALDIEKSVQNYKTQIEELQAKLKNYETSQGQFKQVIEDNKKVIAALQEKLQATEAVINKISEPEAEPEPEIVTDPAFEPGPPLETAEELSARLSESSPDLPAGPVAAQPEKRIAEASVAPPPVAAPAAAPKPAASVVPQPVASAAPVKPLAHKPQVLSVNRKFNFVVIGLGIKDGIQMGDTLEISRQEKVIGNAQVEKLYENFSAATLVHEDKEAPIKEGDSIRKSSP